MVFVVVTTVLTDELLTQRAQSVEVCWPVLEITRHGNLLEGSPRLVPAAPNRREHLVRVGRVAVGEANTLHERQCLDGALLLRDLLLKLLSPL